MKRGIAINRTARRRSHRWLLVLCVVLPAAGIGTTWSLKKPTPDTDAARAFVLSDHAETRTNAVVQLLRDVRKSVAALQAARDAGGDSGAQAQAALDQIAEMAQK